MSWKPILVGVDASPEAAAAAAFGAQIAEAADTPCHLVHAIRDVWSAFADAQLAERAGTFGRALEEARDRVQHALWGATPARLLQLIIVRPGRASAVLNQAVREFDAGMVILGGKHHSALGRWLGGSTSLTVARTTKVPVLVTAGSGRAIRRVLVAVDLSWAAGPTVEAAERCAGLFGADLRGVSVLEPLPVIPEVPIAHDESQYYALLEERLKREIWPLIDMPGVETCVRHGTAVDTILREADEWAADLLVVGSHGKGWVDRLLVGSVTEGLLNHLPTSLLVVPVRPPDEAHGAAAASRSSSR